MAEKSNIDKANKQESENFDFNTFAESENSIFLGGFFLGLSAMYYFGLIGVLVAVIGYSIVQQLKLPNKTRLFILVGAAIIIGVFGQYMVNQVIGSFF